MEKVFNLIQERFLVDGENERYATFLKSKTEVLEEVDQEIFEEKFNIEISKVNFPVIIFESQSDADGRMYESDQQEVILEDAKEYFTAK